MPKLQPNRKKRIFVTVGTDLPFDRLVNAVDLWAGSQKSFDVFAQIGDSEFVPENMDYKKFVEPKDYRSTLENADLIISHAGMGTILTSLRFQKPLLVLSRRASLGEHRNEHQLATAKHLKSIDKVDVAADENELTQFLNSLENVRPRSPIGPHASKKLTDAISDFING